MAEGGAGVLFVMAIKETHGASGRGGCGLDVIRICEGRGDGPQATRVTPGTTFAVPL